MRHSIFGWSGRSPSTSCAHGSDQYEFMQRVKQRLQLGVSIMLAIIFLLLYLNFRGVAESLIVMLALSFSLVGGIWFLWLLGYNTSVAVRVGFIALAGVAAETGVVAHLPRRGVSPTRAPTS